MKFHHGSFLIWTLIVICARLVNATAELGSSPTSTNVEPDGTPSPTHPFTHLLTTVPPRGELDPIPTASEREAGYSLDLSPSPTTGVIPTDGEVFRSKITLPTTEDNGEPFRGARPSPGGVNTDTIEDDYPNFINSTMNKSEALAVGKETQPETTVQPVPSSEGN